MRLGCAAVVIVTLLLASNARAATGESAICYVGAAAYSVAGPAGWQMDSRAGKPSGLCLVVYPLGGSWRASAAVMYVNSMTKGPGEDLAHRVQRDLDDFGHHDPGMRVESLKPAVRVAAGASTIVKRIWAKDSNAFEECVYVDGPDVVAVMVLASRDESAFNGSRSAFEEFVASFTWMERSKLLPAMIRLGKRDEAAPESKEYRKHAMVQLGPALANALSACAPKGSPIPPPFDLVLQTAADGVVDELTVTESSAAAACVKGKLTGTRVPAPPFAPYHFHFAMSVVP